MEYKPPFENKFTKKYRFLYCSLDSDQKWICKRCTQKEQCDPPLLNGQSQKTEWIELSNTLPLFMDQLIVYQKLSSSPKIIQD
jgi:hypothetical protein